MTNATAIRNANLQAVIDELAANMAKTEAAIAAVPADLFVILWNGSVLRTDGAKVAIVGPRIYTGSSRAFMVREAAKFSELGKARGIEDSAATVHTAAQALQIVKAENAELMTKIVSANA